MESEGTTAIHWPKRVPQKPEGEQRGPLRLWGFDCCFCMKKFHFSQPQFWPTVLNHFLFTSDLFLFQFLHINLLFHFLSILP